jgi:hypothetical protein
MSGSCRVSRAPSEGPRAGGLPLCAVSFLFRFPGPLQRVDAPAAPLPQPFPALSQCVGKRVRRHIEKRQLVPAAVGFPIHRHIEDEVGSRRTRFRGHVGDTPQLLAVSEGHERLEQSRQRLWGDRACSRIQGATTSPTRRPGFDRSVFGRSALPVLALPLRVRRPCQDIPSSRNQAARRTCASRDDRNETGPPEPSPFGRLIARPPRQDRAASQAHSAATVLACSGLDLRALRHRD